MSIHYRVPDIVSGYVLNPERGWFSIIRPEATTNLIDTPSAENANIGCVDIGFGAISRTTAYQRRGAWSVDGSTGAGVPDDGIVCFGSSGTGFSLTAGTTYTFSVDVLVLQAGTPMKIWFATNAGVQLGTPKQFRATGLWQRIHVTYTETVSANRFLYVTKDNDTRAINLYVDGLQLEAKAYPTTYCDGDLKGFLVNEFPPAYLWTGTPHLSTSTRSAQTRTGGRVINLDDYDFQVSAYTGLGMPQLNNVSTPFGLQDGALYQRTIAQPRTFVLSGTFETDGFQQLQRQRTQLITDVSRDIVAQQQPMLLRYHPYRCLRPIGDEFNIVCNYRSGLEGVTDNLYREQVPLQFDKFLPMIQRAGDSGDQLAVLSDIPDADYALYRSNQGFWQALSTGLDGPVFAIAYRNDGTIVLGGAFSVAGGVACNNIALYSPITNTFSALGAGVDNTVLALLILPDNSIVVGGAFLNAGGNPANRVAVYSLGVWSTYGTGFNDAVRTIARLQDGTLLFGGSFTTASGGAALRLAQWDGAVLSQYGGGANSTVFSLVTDGTTVYAGGSFTTIGGVAANRIARRSGGTWTALGIGMTNNVFALALDSSGILYAGGEFVSPAQYIASWNGSAWSSLGTGVDNFVYSLAWTAARGLIVGGTFSTANGQALPTVGLAQWSRSVWSTLDIILPASSDPVRAIASGYDGSITIGFNAPGTAQISTNTITNTGNANAYPKLTITGPTTGTARIYQFLNLTTGDAMYFDYTINAGETAVLDLTPGNISFMSDFQGDIFGTILPGSNPAIWRLQPGNNVISFFAADNSIIATLVWQDQFLSVDSAVY